MDTQTTWVIDPIHSEISFKVRHMMITNVKGQFRDFTAKVESTEEGFERATVTAENDARSIFTNNEKRDTHLKSSDFFGVENHPTLTFESSSFTELGKETYQLKGLLTMKGVSNEIELDVKFGGLLPDPFGEEGDKRAGFSFNGKIDRTEWGLRYNDILESGGVAVSEQVRISGEVQFVKQKVPAS